MAKHCEVCNQDYADELPVCPHCAAAKKTHLASRAEDRTTQLANINPAEAPGESKTTHHEIHFGDVADSAVDLGRGPTNKPATGDFGGAATGDAAGAVPHSHGEEELVGELGGHFPTPPAHAGDDSESIDLTAAPPKPSHGVSDSEVDLGATIPEIVEEGSGAVLHERPSGESEVFVAELASDASKIDLVGDSGIDLGGADVVDLGGSLHSGSAIPPREKAPIQEAAAEAVEATAAAESPEADLAEQVVLDARAADDESSAVDLGAEPGEVEEVVEAVEAEEVAEAASDSGIDLQGLNVPQAAKSGARPSSDSSVDLGSQAEIVDVGEAVEAEAAGSSGLDLLGLSGASSSEVHPGSESSMELPAPPETPAAKADEPPPGESDIAFQSLLAGESGVKPPAEEPVVSEREVDELLAGLDHPPGEGEVKEMAEGETAEEVAEGQEAVASAEEEEAAEAEEKKPAKPVKQGSRLPAMVGGTCLGLLLGAGGLIGARFGGLDVPAMIGAGEKPKAQVKATGTQQAQAPSFAQRAAMLRNGDFAEAEKAGIENIQETNPQELATRGEYRLNAYLQKAGAKFNPQDPALQSALADLKKAADLKDPDAAYNLGLINELAGKFPEAQAEYQKGAQAFQNDPVQKRRFQSALDRVEWKAAAKAAGAAMLPALPQDRAAMLALLLVAFQPPQGQQPGQAPIPPQGQAPAAAETEEAGYDFWNAVKLAREGKFADASRVLDKARTLHDQRRFSRLRKAQNPLSDPTEDIFLRCCDELKASWKMQDRLRGGGYLTEKTTPPQALENLFQKAQTSEGVVKDIADKLVGEKIITKADDVSKGVDGLIAEKKKAEAEAADLKTKLKKADADALALQTDLKTAKEMAEARLADLKKAAESGKKLQADNATLSAMLKKIEDELAAAKLLDPKGKSNVSEAVKKAVDVAKMKDPNGALRKQQNEIAQLQAALQQTWQPEEMMPMWLMLLEQNRGRTDFSTKAARDAGRIQANPGATAAQKGQAGVVQGLALRNSEKFAEAKAALETARVAVDQGMWSAAATAALREVSDPAAYYAIQARTLSDRGQLDNALALLSRAQKVLPEKDHGKLFAMRSLIELDAARARAKGMLPPSDPLVEAARKDAAAAAKAGLAEGHYAAGRVAEALGEWDAAIQNYRKAVAAHNVVDAEGSRYRIALARVLLQPRATQPAANKVGWRDPAPYPARHVAETKALVRMVVLGLQAPLLPGEELGLEEAEKLADEVLRAPANAVPFNVRAQALAIKGRWTPALQLYIEGILPMLPREYREGLVFLIRNHPRLKRPDRLLIPNPLEAEKHFSAGLNFYFDCEFANAEKSFLLAVENDGKDARYFYFLGLSRLSQNRRRDAAEDFDQGAMLERLNRPASAAVNEALERIQGPNRAIVNEYRNRPER